MMKLLVVGLGGFCGAIARYTLSGLAHRLTGATFPVGTLMVNLLGCLAIGVLMALVEDRQWLSAEMRLFLIIGLLGSMTTFSTMGHETVELLRDGSYLLSVANVLANVLLGIGAVIAGRAAAKILA